MLLSSKHRGTNTLQKHYEVRYNSTAGHSYIACNRHPSTRPDCDQHSAEERGGGREKGEMKGGGGGHKREMSRSDKLQ